MKNYFYLRIRPLSLLFILLISFPLLSWAQGFGPKTEARLQAAIDAIQNDPAKPFVGGMSVAIKVDGGPEWQGATGYAARNTDLQNNLLPGGTPFTPGTLSQMYSVTKTFTAPLVLELAQEGYFGLDEPFIKYIPVPLSQINPKLDPTVTIRQLLAHESGYSDFVTELQVLLQVAAQPGKVWTPEEAVALLNQIFPPGTKRQYSNTNYLILGALVEIVTGKPLEQHYRERFFTPLGLESMYLGVREQIGNRGVLAAPHDNISQFNPIFMQLGLPTFPNAYTNISRFPMQAIISLAFAGGGLVSNAADLAEWGSALFGGRATSQATLDMMLNSFYPTPDVNGNYLGYGVKLIPLIDNADPFLGHNGDAPGYRSILVHEPHQKVTIAVLTNFAGADPYVIARAVYQALAPQILSFAPATGAPGTTVTIQGEGLATTTNVSFNGVAANFNIISEDEIEATVPATATTGLITVVTAGGTAASSSPFTILNVNPNCSLMLTTKVTQAEPWYGMWGAFNGAGMIDLSVSGGTAPYTYRWSAGVSTQDLGLASPGMYSVLVTDATGCTGWTTVQVGRKNDFLRVLSSHQDVSSAGASDGSIDLTVVGGVVPATYLWSNGAITEDLTGLAAGTYSVIVTDAFGRKTMTSVVVGTKGAPLAVSVAHQNVSATGKQDGSVDLTVTGGMGPYTYLWNTGAWTEDLHYATPGDYMVTVTDAMGATATAMVRVEVGRAPIMLARRAGSEDLFSSSVAGLTAYPNPAIEQATVNFSLPQAGKYSLELYDLRGAKVKTLASGTAKAHQNLAVAVDVASYAKGVYLLKLVTDKQVSAKRLLVGR